MSRNRGSTTYRFAPAALTGESIALPVTDDGSAANVIIKPTQGITTASLVWPSNAPDRMAMRITCTGVITGLTNTPGTNSNGIVDSVQSALTTLLSGSRGVWVYDLTDAMWYRYA